MIFGSLHVSGSTGYINLQSADSGTSLTTTGEMILSTAGSLNGSIQIIIKFFHKNFIKLFGNI